MKFVVLSLKVILMKKLKNCKWKFPYGNIQEGIIQQKNYKKKMKKDLN